MYVVDQEAACASKVSRGKRDCSRPDEWLDEAASVGWNTPDNLLRKLSLASLVWERMWDASNRAHCGSSLSREGGQDHAARSCAFPELGDINRLVHLAVALEPSHLPSLGVFGDVPEKLDSLSLVAGLTRVIHWDNHLDLDDHHVLVSVYQSCSFDSFAWNTHG